MGFCRLFVEVEVIWTVDGVLRFVEWDGMGWDGERMEYANRGSSVSRL